MVRGVSPVLDNLGVISPPELVLNLFQIRNDKAIRVVSAMQATFEDLTLTVISCTTITLHNQE